MSKRRGSFDDNELGKRDMVRRTLQRVGSFDKLSADLPSIQAADNVLNRSFSAASGDSGGAATNLLSSVAHAKKAVPAKPATYAGLSNQGATCYMNSLLQTLFMTPEFRRVLYLWRYNPGGDDDEADCIPLQLQLLFGQLQLTELRAIPTTALTKSFGWTSRDSFQQHDVQELARVLFDALERSLVKTPNAQLTNLLFKGTLHDLVKCKECGNERKRADTFLDLSLVIKPFGATKSVASVEEALAEYIKQEEMDGSDKVSCDRCGVRTASTKGLRIAEPPYLLQLQLKRFVFDYVAMDHQKLNDKVTFPLVLDLNQYVAVADDSVVTIDADPEAGGTAATVMTPPQACQDEVVPTGAQADPEVSTLELARDLIRKNGPHVYELYGVLVHSGGARSGHYYAYIKDLDTQQWNSFNDSNVSPIEAKEVLAACGGDSTSSYGTYSYSYASTANAYMLMYRKVFEDVMRTEVTFQAAPASGELAAAPSYTMLRVLPTADDVPDYIREKITQEDAVVRAQQAAEKLAREQMSIKVHFQKQQKYMSVRKSATVAEATMIAWQLFHLDGAARADDTQSPVVVGTDPQTAAVVVSTDECIPLDCVRLRKYAPHTGTPKEPLSALPQPDCSTDAVSGSPPTLEACGVNAYIDLLLETRPSTAVPWEEYDPDGIMIECIQYNSTTDSFLPAVRFCVNKSKRLADLGIKVSTATGISRERLRMLKLHSYGINPECKEYLTNAAMGIVPLDADAAVALSSQVFPRDNIGRVVGDSMQLGTDLNLRYYDTAKIYVEELNMSSVLDEFDPFTAHADEVERSVISTSVPPTSEPLFSGSVHSTGSSSISCNSVASSNAGNSFAISDRGMRCITALQSPAVRCFERQLNSVCWNFTLPGCATPCGQITVDQRISARELYLLLASQVHLEFGAFYVRKDALSGRVIKLSDEAGCLKDGAWASTRVGTLFVCLGVTPQSDEFVATIFLKVPMADAILGTSWIGDTPPPPLSASSGAGAAPLATTAATRIWLPAPLKEGEAASIAETAKLSDAICFSPSPRCDPLVDSAGIVLLPDTFVSLTTCNITMATTIETLCAAAMHALQKRGLLLPSSHSVRLRTKTGHRLTHILYPDENVKTRHSYLYDTIEFGVEIIRHEDIASGSTMSMMGSPLAARPLRRLIYVCWWDRIRWVLTSRREVSVAPIESMRALAVRLANVPGVAIATQDFADVARAHFRPPPPPPPVEPTGTKRDDGQARNCLMDGVSAAASSEDPVTRLLRSMHFLVVDSAKMLPLAGKLQSMQWKHLHSDDRTVGAYSVGLEDGCTLVLADFDVPIRPLTSAEKVAFGMTGSSVQDAQPFDDSGVSSTTQRGNANTWFSSSYSYSAPSRKESGITIKTKSEREAQKSKEIDHHAARMAATSPVIDAGDAAREADGINPPAKIAQAALHDYLPGGGSRREASAFTNPLYKPRNSVMAASLLNTHKLQEEVEMDKALEPDASMLSRKQFLLEAGIVEEHGICASGSGMALFDDLLGVD